MDKIANMLIKLKNAGNAGHNSVSLPYSKLRHEIANCLKKAGFVSEVSKSTDKGEKFVLEVALVKVGNDPRITQVERISKPSKRVYIKAKDLKPIRQGTGVMVLSTPKGIMLARDAKKELVGGEALFRIW